MLKIHRMLTIDALFSAFEVVRDKTFHFDGERHNFWELVYVVSGCIGVAEDEKIYKLEKGEIIFHMPMEFHRIWSAEDSNPHIIIMSFSAQGTGFDALGAGVFSVTDDADLRKALSFASHCRHFDDPIKNQLAALCLEKFLLTVLEHQIPQSRQERTRGTEHYRRVIRIMNDHVGCNLSSLEIAELCGLSLSNLKKIFKKYADTGVMEYFNRLKMTRAMTLISEGISMAEISERLGFSSPNYFSDAFRRQCGLSPTEYRKRFISGTQDFLL